MHPVRWRLVTAGIAVGAALQLSSVARPATIAWQNGPSRVELGGIAHLDLPAEFAFTGAAGAAIFLTATHNPPSGHEIGVIVPIVHDSTRGWFVSFEQVAAGHIRDEERETLAPDTLLRSIRDDAAARNRARLAAGWPTLTVTGWALPPVYDDTSHRLSWSVAGTTPTGAVTNHSVRFLGRRGYVTAEMVVRKALDAEVATQFDTLMDRFAFDPGHRYGDFRPGDPVANVQLGDLVVREAITLAKRPGLFTRLWRFLAFTMVVVAFLARRLYRTLRRRSPLSDADR
ncbi:MAG: DUF2167 domain-containing protein [Acidobacteriota bacterium]